MATMHDDILATIESKNEIDKIAKKYKNQTEEDRKANLQDIQNLAETDTQLTEEWEGTYGNTLQNLSNYINTTTPERLAQNRSMRVALQFQAMERTAEKELAGRGLTGSRLKQAALQKMKLEQIRQSSDIYAQAEQEVVNQQKQFAHMGLTAGTARNQALFKRRASLEDRKRSVRAEYRQGLTDQIRHQQLKYNIAQGSLKDQWNVATGIATFGAQLAGTVIGAAAGNPGALAGAAGAAGGGGGGAPLPLGPRPSLSVG